MKQLLLIIFCGVLLFISIFIIGYSYYIQFNLNKLRDASREDASPGFREKLFIYANNTQQKQLSRVLIINLILAASLLIVIINQLNMGITDRKLTTEVDDLQGKVTGLSNAQTNLLSGLPITPYDPQKAALDKFKWVKLFGNDRQEQIKQEANLSQIITPFFGYYQTVTTISTNPQVLTITFVIGNRSTWWMDVDNNLRNFLDDLAQKTKLTDIVIQSKDTVGTLTKATYSRKVGDTTFTKSLEQTN